MEHICIHETDFGKILDNLDRIYKDYYGNGAKGMRNDVAELKVSMQNINCTLRDLTTNVSALMKWQVSMNAIDNYVDKTKLTARQKAAIYVSAIIGMSGIIVSIILKFI